MHLVWFKVGYEFFLFSQTILLFSSPDQQNIYLMSFLTSFEMTIN